MDSWLQVVTAPQSEWEMKVAEFRKNVFERVGVAAAKRRDVSFSFYSAVHALSL